MICRNLHFFLYASLASPLLYIMCAAKVIMQLSVVHISCRLWWNLTVYLWTRISRMQQSKLRYLQFISTFFVCLFVYICSPFSPLPPLTHYLLSFLRALKVTRSIYRMRGNPRRMVCWIRSFSNSMPLWTEKLILKMFCKVKERYRRVVSLVWNPVKIKLRSMEIRKKVLRVGKSAVKMTIDLNQTKRRDPNYSDSDKYQDASIFLWIAHGGSWRGTLKVLFLLVLE